MLTSFMLIKKSNEHEKVIDWIKSEIQEDLKLERSMKNHCLK